MFPSIPLLSTKYQISYNIADKTIGQDLSNEGNMIFLIRLYMLEIVFICSLFYFILQHPLKSCRKVTQSWNAFLFFSKSFNESLRPLLVLTTAHFKTACTKLRNGLRDSLNNLEQNWNIFCEWEIIRHLFRGRCKINYMKKLCT